MCENSSIEKEAGKQVRDLVVSQFHMSHTDPYDVLSDHSGRQRCHYIVWKDVVNI